MGRISKNDIEKFKVTGFRPLELNEGNVQAIFNRCWRENPSSLYYASAPFLMAENLNPYLYSSASIHFFDCESILGNQTTIRYLFGQLKEIHTGGTSISWKLLPRSYSGKKWANDEHYCRMLCYLGSCRRDEKLHYDSNSDIDIALILPFIKKTDGYSAVCMGRITPTLSPKDPNFPAWWEAHKGEWVE